MSAQHHTQKSAELDGELIARMLLSEETPSISDEMTAQLVAARMGITIADADRFKSLYTIQEIMGLRDIGQQYVEYVVTDEGNQVLKRRQVDSDTYKVSRRMGGRDATKERPN